MLPDQVLGFFANYIHKQLGIVYAEHNYFQLNNRLEEIAKLMGVTSVEDLFKQAQRSIDGQFKQLLLDIATNNETSFFRDPKIFQAIRSKVLDSRLQAPTSAPLRIWSAASSSGQEALSVSMTIREWCEKNSKPIDYSIVGTDISERILAKAKQAQYTQLEIQRGLPANLLLKYFTKNEQDQWTAKPELMQKINYLRMNLKEVFPFKPKFDLILCRNVLIYQNVESKIEILKRMTQCLEPGGLLVLGAAEGLLGLSQDYEPVSVEGSVLYQYKQHLRVAA